MTNFVSNAKIPMRIYANCESSKANKKDRRKQAQGLLTTVFSCYGRNGARTHFPSHISCYFTAFWFFRVNAVSNVYPVLFVPIIHIMLIVKRVIIPKGHPQILVVLFVDGRGECFASLS